MALVTIGFLALVLVTLFWLAWAVVWLVAALFWFALPLTLLVLAAVAWRAQARYWQRVQQSGAGDAASARSPLRQTGNRAFDEYREQALRSLERSGRSSASSSSSGAGRRIAKPSTATWPRAGRSSRTDSRV